MASKHNCPAAKTGAFATALASVDCHRTTHGLSSVPRRHSWAMRRRGAVSGIHAEYDGDRATTRLRGVEGEGHRGPARRRAEPALSGAHRRRHDRLPHRGQREVPVGAVRRRVHRARALRASDHVDRSRDCRGASPRSRGSRHRRARLHPRQPVRSHADAAAAVQRAGLRQRPQREDRSGDAARRGRRGRARLRVRRALGTGARGQGQVLRLPAGQRHPRHPHEPGEQRRGSSATTACIRTAACWCTSPDSTSGRRCS